MVPLLMHDSVTLIIWKIMTYCYSHATNTSTLYFTVWKKNHILLLCNITVDLIRQSEYWVSVKFQQQIQVFQNSILCLKAQILSLETNTVSCFSWSGRLTSFILKKISPEYPCLSNPHFCISLLLNKNDVSWEKRHTYLSLRQRGFLMLLSPSIWRRHGFMGQDLICFVLFNSSVMSDSAPPLTAACQASLSFTVSRSLLKLMAI